ncbi:MAG: biotin/lipoyl-binding protein [Candidatus Pacebacteria bacterium]|nr:biotin/lipoyl-binding protein [Candidatus Paceibacterota bacterium]MBP9867286.1 biotin/lipoyl-binding protein [Candidatus Paceibacterota bacterium]
MKKITSFFVYIYTLGKEHRILTLLIILSALGFGYYYYNNQSTSVTSYQYTTVTRGPLTSIVSSTGQIISNSQVDLKPKVNANVTGVYVRAGDRVKAGQVLFRLDATDAYKQVRDAKTSLESANIALEKLRNPKTIDVMSIKNAIQQEEDAKKIQDQKVETAYRVLLSSNLQAVSASSYTTETAPTITGSYTKNKEGQIKISVYQGGTSGYTFMATGLVSGSGQANTLVSQPIEDTGLYIKWNNSNPSSGWIIDIPNKQATSYSSNYESWKNAVINRDIANATSDRTIESLKQKLADLTPGDDNVDVRSAKLQVEQRQNALYDAQQSLADYTITAPFDGVMASVSVDVGASAVMASANTSSALGTIVTDKKLAQITVNESDIVKLTLGQKANMTFDAIEGLTLTGDVVEINTLGAVTSGVVTYKAKLAFATYDPRILPNMTVSVDIVTDSKDNVLYVPTQAIKHDTNGYYVEKETNQGAQSTSTRRMAYATSTAFIGDRASSTWKKTASSTRKRPESALNTQEKQSQTTLIRIPVTIGTQNDTHTEIISGLYEGEKIILKKITTTSSANKTTTPSVTSLLRPQGTRTTGSMPRN